MNIFPKAIHRFLNCVIDRSGSMLTETTWLFFIFNCVISNKIENNLIIQIVLTKKKSKKKKENKRFLVAYFLCISSV